MGKKRQVEDESLTIERLEKEIKELKSVNKSLLRQLKKESRKYKPEFEEDDNSSSAVVKEDETNKLRKICTECGRGKIIETPLGSRTLIGCTICSYRKTVKQTA